MKSRYKSQAIDKSIYKHKNSQKFDNNHSVENNIEFIDRVKAIEVLSTYKLVSFDIANIYTSIPLKDNIQILKTNLIKTVVLNQ